MFLGFLQKNWMVRRPSSKHPAEARHLGEERVHVVRCHHAHEHHATERESPSDTRLAVPVHHLRNERGEEDESERVPGVEERFPCDEQVVERHLILSLEIGQQVQNAERAENETDHHQHRMTNEPRAIVVVENRRRLLQSIDDPEVERESDAKHGHQILRTPVSEWKRRGEIHTWALQSLCNLE